MILWVYGVRSTVGETPERRSTKRCECLEVQAQTRHPSLRCLRSTVKCSYLRLRSDTPSWPEQFITRRCLSMPVGILVQRTAFPDSRLSGLSIQ